MLLCSHHENSSLSTAVYKQSCFAFMEKQFVAEEPQQWLVPKRAEAISQGTGVRIIKATTPPALIAIPVGTLRKEIGVCLGHEDQRPISLLQGSCSACSTAEPGRKLKGCVVDGLTLWWWGQGAPGNWHRLVKQKHSWGERRKLFIRWSKFINFSLPLSIYFNCLLASSLLLFLPLLPSMLHYYCRK